MNKHHREVDADVAAAETKIVGTLTGQPLGVLDAGRVKKAIEIVSGAYTLKFAVTPEDIYAPGFVQLTRSTRTGLIGLSSACRFSALTA